MLLVIFTKIKFNKILKSSFFKKFDNKKILINSSIKFVFNKIFLLSKFMLFKKFRKNKFLFFIKKHNLLNF
jgi:hypothetical protein